MKRPFAQIIVNRIKVLSLGQSRTESDSPLGLSLSVSHCQRTSFGTDDSPIHHRASTSHVSVTVKLTQSQVD